MYEVLLFSLYMNLCSSSFLPSSRGESFASTCMDSTGEVPKASVNILMPFLCMLSSFFNILAEPVLYNYIIIKGIYSFKCVNNYYVDIGHMCLVGMIKR